MTPSFREPFGCSPVTLRRLALVVALGSAALSSPARAQSGEPLRVTIQTTRVRGHALPRLDALLTIAAPIDRVWALVSDCQRAREFMDLATTLAGNAWKSKR